jgi:hypothetical protein
MVREKLMDTPPAVCGHTRMFFTDRERGAREKCRRNAASMLRVDFHAQ